MESWDQLCAGLVSEATSSARVHLIDDYLLKNKEVSRLALLTKLLQQGRISTADLLELACSINRQLAASGYTLEGPMPKAVPSSPIRRTAPSVPPGFRQPPSAQQPAPPTLQSAPEPDSESELVSSPTPGREVGPELSSTPGRERPLMPHYDGGDDCAQIVGGRDESSGGVEGEGVAGSMADSPLSSWDTPAKVPSPPLPETPVQQLDAVPAAAPAAATPPAESSAR